MGHLGTERQNSEGGDGKSAEGHGLWSPEQSQAMRQEPMSRRSEKNAIRFERGASCLDFR